MLMTILLKKSYVFNSCIDEENSYNYMNMLKKEFNIKLTPIELLALLYSLL